MFLGKQRLRCGEKLAHVRDGCGRRRFSVESYSRSARAVELRVPGGFFSSLLTLCYGSLHVLRYFVHWNWCIKAVCSTVLCCNSIAFCETASADRNGMAAPRLSKGTCSSVAPCESDCVLRIIVGRLQYCYIKDAI